MYGYSQEEYRRFRSHAWRYLLFFSLLYCFLYCTRLNLSNAGALMTEGLGWSKTDFGILTGALFWAYGIGQFVNGRLGEIAGPAKFVVSSVVLSVVANVGMAFLDSLPAMAVLWGLNGYFQSMAWTPGVAILARWWPGRSRGFAVGFAHAFAGFGQIAAILSVSLGFALFPSLGWRSAFVVSAAFPLVALAAYMVWSRTGPSKIGLSEYVESDPERAKIEDEMCAIVAERGRLYPYRHVLSDRRFVLWLAVVFLAGLLCYGLITWMPMCFISRFGMDATDGLLGSATLPVGMGVGTLVVTSLTDLRCPGNRLQAVIACGAVAAVGIAGVFFLDPTDALQKFAIWVLLFVTGFSVYAINGVAWAYATDVGGRVFSATALGILNFASYMGAAVQSLLCGHILDRAGWGLVFVSLSLSSLAVSFLGLAGSLSAMPSREK